MEENKNLEVVENTEATELVNNEGEAKKAKIAKAVKTGLKIAGVALVGVLGYALGAKSSKKVEYNEPEIIDSDEE